jgi:hypothetical protein
MAVLWRTPILPAGIALFVLGVGNWILSHNRIVEYTQRSRPSNSNIPAPDLTDYPELTPRTNAMLVERLHRGGAAHSHVEAKLEFYRVVKRGGRTLVAAGLLLIGLAPIHARRRAHGPPGGTAQLPVG